MLRWPPLRQEMQRRPHISPPLPPAPPTRPSSQGASSPAALAARGCGREFVPRPRLLVAFPRLLFPRAVSLSVVSVAPSSSGAVAPPPPCRPRAAAATAGPVAPPLPYLAPVVYPDRGLAPRLGWRAFAGSPLPSNPPPTHKYTHTPHSPAVRVTHRPTPPHRSCPCPFFSCTSVRFCLNRHLHSLFRFAFDPFPLPLLHEPAAGWRRRPGRSCLPTPSHRTRFGVEGKWTRLIREGKSRHLNCTA